MHMYSAVATGKNKQNTCSLFSTLHKRMLWSSQLFKTQHRQEQVNQPEVSLLLDQICDSIIEHCAHLECDSPFLSCSGLGG